MQSIPLNRLNGILLMLVLAVTILYIGKAFLVPLVFSILLCMLLYPLCEKLEKWGIGRVGSTLIGMLVFILFLVGIVAIIAGQGASMAEDLPQMQKRAMELFASIQHWAENSIGISPEKQQDYIEKAGNKASQGGGDLAGSILSGIMGLLAGLVLVLLYFFFIMWKREKFREFILRLVDEENRPRVKKEMSEISKVSGQYLIGRLVSMSFLAVIYMIGFSIVGLPNGVLIALIAVLPTIVPYVGAFIGGFFPVAIALVGGSGDLILPVILILVIAQAIDNNLIEPLVEGESLDISPIFTIIAIVLGELIWGIAGMILFIPMFAILKIICDHIPALHPYSFLLTNEVSEPKWLKKIRGWFGK